MTATTKLIAELKELEAKATPRPWEQSFNGRGICTNAGSYIAHPEHGFKADAALIVAMRNALPELIEQIEYLDEEAGGYHDEWQAAERSLKEWQELWNDLLALAGIELEPGDEATAKDVYDQIALKFSEERDAALARAEQMQAERDWLAEQCEGWAKQNNAPALTKTWWLDEVAKRGEEV